ncbi:MAG: hypothetical protein IJC29_03165 [Clostridia bacterium]|nr:hypothetical protein [Clostridia bacterium]
MVFSLLFRFGFDGLGREFPPWKFSMVLHCETAQQTLRFVQNRGGCPVIGTKNKNPPFMGVFVFLVSFDGLGREFPPWKFSMVLHRETTRQTLRFVQNRGNLRQSIK